MLSLNIRDVRSSAIAVEAVMSRAKIAIASLCIFILSFFSYCRL
jgi:hypothetical protein